MCFCFRNKSLHLSPDSYCCYSYYFVFDFWTIKRKMFSHHSFEYFKILLCIFGPINFGLITANGRFEESIVFPSTYLQRQRAFELLTNNAISSESVVELSRSSEAFSLEYFQVIIFFITYVLASNNFYSH